MDVIVRKATLEDVNKIVKIHKAAFKDFFLTGLGERFLRLYYSTFISNDRGVVFCAERNNTIIGFSASSYYSKGFNAKLIKNNLSNYGVEAIRLIFTQPNSILRLLKNLNKESKDTTVNDNGSYAELYSIAVSPDCQGVGVGRLLLTATEADVREHNTQISLTTDYYNNDKTIAFYHALGYKDYYVFMTYPNRKMWRMIKVLKD